MRIQTLLVERELHIFALFAADGATKNIYFSTSKIMSTPLEQPSFFERDTCTSTPLPNRNRLSAKSDGALFSQKHDPATRSEVFAHKRQRFKSLQGGLSVKGEFNFGIPTQKGAQDHVEEHHGSESWRMKVLEFIHQKWVQYTLMSLLVLDVLLLFIELLLLTQFPMCAIIERDCISCCPGSDYNTTDDGHRTLRFLSGEDDEHHDGICEAGLQADYDTGGCDPHKWHAVHTIELVIFSLTLVILSLFFIELNLEMIALHPNIFFRQFFYALDYFIVGVSLVLEISLYFLDQETLATFVGLLVFTRIWRFVRIGHGIVEVTSELTHQKYEELLVYTAVLEANAKKSNIELPECPKSVLQALEEHSSLQHHGLENDP